MEVILRIISGRDTIFRSRWYLAIARGKVPYERGCGQEPSPGEWGPASDATIADRSTFTDPHQYPVGIPYVLVNGVAVVDAGAQTDATPGKVLTRA